MSPAERIWAIVVPVAGGALVLGLGEGVGWPVALGVLALLVAMALAVLVARIVRYRRAQAELRRQFEAGDTIRVAPADLPPEPAPQARPEDRPAVPREVSELTVSDVPLPSAESEFRFLFSGTVRWQRGPHVSGVSHASPASLAADSVLSRAAHLTSTQSPGDHGLVRHRLAAALGVVMADSSGQVLAWADDVDLTVLDDDADVLRKLATLRKQETLWRRERDFERHVRAYLTEEALQNTGSAVVWWLARHTDQVEQAVALLGTLAQLSAAANGDEVDERYRHLLPPSPRLPSEQHRLLGTERFLNGEAR